MENYYYFYYYSSSFIYLSIFIIMMMMFGRGFLWWKKLERKAPLSTCASLLLHLLLESDRNRKTGERERTRLHRWRRLALVDPHDGRDIILEGFPYMDSALSASSFLKCSFVPTTSGLRYREKGRLIQSIFHFLSLKTLVNRRGTLGFLFSSLASLVTNPLFEFKSEKKVLGVEVYPLKMMWFMRFSGLLFAIMMMTVRCHSHWWGS